MAEGRLDEEGRLVLPAEVRSALGWQPGQALQLQVDGDALVAQPSTPVGSFKDEARRLASAMRDLTSGALGAAARKVQETAATAAPAAPKPGPSPDGVPAPPTQGGAFQGLRPHLGEGVYLAPGSTVVGDVQFGKDCSIWPGAVLRGDVAAVRVGEGTNVQDGAVLHVSPHLPCVVGARVTIGHQATVHACTVEDDVLIGIHAVVLDGARVGRHCIVAAGTVVPPGMEIPSGKMVMGVPARVVRDLTPEEIQRIHWNASSYVGLKGQYLRPAPAAPETATERPAPAPAPPGALPRYECRRAAGEISVDGSLDDPGWKGAVPLSRLRLASGAGEPAQETEVLAAWDEHHLYVAFSCKDSDIWGNFTQRDDPLYDEEVVEVFLCPTGDLRHYYEIEVSPCNVLFDAYVFNPEGDRRTMLVDRQWNAAGIRTAVRVAGTLNDRSSHDLGWITEIAIPFADLGLSGPPAPGTVWRANFYRIERGEVTEFSAWSPTHKDPADFHVPACFGELVFVNG
ncbi:MAG: carbohydrate-binding family 9-like protein [Armatimonadota bacterium]